MGRTSSFEEILLDPAKFFSHPDEVVACGEYSLAQKEAILDRWIADERRLAESSGEGMDGGEQNRLGAVTKARLQLR